MSPILQPTPMGSAIAAALVVAGAPMFSAGLRSLRLRRHLRGLDARSPSEEPNGFGLIRGRVALESPLVGPLSGQACAGYQLEVLGPGSMHVARLDDLRPFRLVGEGESAHVAGVDGRWDLSAVAEREVAPGDALTENLTALLSRSAEAMWLRRCGLHVTLVERALLAGDECFVIGSARAAEPYELASDLELLRTGTDDQPALASTSSPRPPTRWIEADGHLEFLRISDHPPTARALAVPSWRTLGLVVGPILTLAGLLYLAALADALRAVSRFVR